MHHAIQILQTLIGRSFQLIHDQEMNRGLSLISIWQHINDTVQQNETARN